MIERTEMKNSNASISVPVEKYVEVYAPDESRAENRNRIRVAAYCRVSTDSEEQLYSLDNQMNAFTHQIGLHDDWELVEIYVDEGISGTSVKKRQGFQKLIHDCEAGKIDYIITKSISRFARNTADCLNYVRLLQKMGVQILFEKEGIDTSESYSEMLLTIMAAFAQEESRSISENVKWGMRKRFEAGQEIPMPIYGYRHTEKEMYQIVPEEAEVVQEIFKRFVHGESTSIIAKDLIARNVPAPFSRKWDSGQISRILKNIKYTGDVILQKNYVTDHLTHKMVKNKGELPIYHVHNAHPALIDKHLFEQADKISKLRNVSNGNCQYPYAEMLKCPYCGKTLVHGSLDGVYLAKSQKNKGGAWGCYGPDGCRKYLIVQNVLNETMLSALHMKQGSEMKTVEYYWLDDLIDSITLKKNDTVTIAWKDQTKDTLPFSISDDDMKPLNTAVKYNRFIENLSKRENRKNRYRMGLPVKDSNDTPDTCKKQKANSEKEGECL